MDLLASYLSAGFLSVFVAAGVAWLVMPEHVRESLRRWWGDMR